MSEYAFTARSPADVDVFVGWLEGKGKSIHSQNPEDGLIEATFERIGESNQWCFEVGCGNGVTLSNTRCLREKGWTAILIDADPGQIKAARDSALPGDQCIEETLYPHTLDGILTKYGAPEDIDFGVIDIDGWDACAFEHLHKFRPRVILVECNHASYPPYFQVGFDELIEIGLRKNYTPVAATMVNILFVANEAL